LRRRRRRLILIISTVLVAVIAAAATMAATARVIWSWQVRHAHALLAEQLQGTIGLGQRVLDQSATQMEKVGTVWTGGCGPDALDLLRDVTFHSLVIGEAIFYDDTMAAVCTNYGAPAKAFSVDQDMAGLLRAHPLPVALSERSPIQGSRTIDLYRRVAKGIISTHLNPALLDTILAQDVLQPDMWTGLLLKGGTVLAQSDRAGAPAGLKRVAAAAAADVPRLLDATAASPLLYVTKPLGGFPITAMVSTREPVLADVWRDGAVPIVAGGVLAASLAAALGFALFRRSRSLDEDLRIAIRDDELELHYLPIIEVETGRCVGAEALMRWRHPERGLIRPDLFIPQAEESGMILPMTDWALQRVVRDFADGPPTGAPFHISINLTGRHFQMPGLAESLSRAFSTSALKPMHLVFEVTEREAMDAKDGQATRSIGDIRGWGAGVSLDDFGTGYCGLRYLQQYRVDYLKIDKSFTDTIGTEGVLSSVVDLIIDLGHKMKLELVAEGVEREEQLAYLRARGVRYVQGFLFAKPMPAKSFLDFVRQRADGAVAAVAAVAAK
jgi:sensor c-di-GMP phosphodiesterase-like protein